MPIMPKDADINTAPYYLVLFADRAELADDVHSLVNNYLFHAGVPAEDNIQSIRLVTPAADLPEVTLTEVEAKLGFEVRLADDPDTLVEAVTYIDPLRGYVATYDLFVDGYPID